jgi:hypothetical protein
MKIGNAVFRDCIVDQHGALDLDAENIGDSHYNEAIAFHAHDEISEQ